MARSDIVPLLFAILCIIHVWSISRGNKTEVPVWHHAHDSCEQPVGGNKQKATRSLLQFSMQADTVWWWILTTDWKAYSWKHQGGGAHVLHTLNWKTEFWSNLQDTFNGTVTEMQVGGGAQVAVLQKMIESANNDQIYVNVRKALRFRIPWALQLSKDLCP